MKQTTFALFVLIAVLFGSCKTDQAIKETTANTETPTMKCPDDVQGL